MPGYSDAEADIRALGERLGGYKQVERVEILPYHTLGVHKYEAMGKEYRLAGVQENTPEQSERAAANRASRHKKRRTAAKKNRGGALFFVSSQKSD